MLIEKQYVVSDLEILQELKSVKPDVLGSVFEMKDGSKVKVIKYNSSRSLTVEFSDTGYQLNTRLDRVRNGLLKDRLKPSVFGVGVLGVDKISVGGKHCKEYLIWGGMLDRCYNWKTQEKQKTYVGCSVSDNFKYFPYFKEWCQSQVGFDQKGWHLDKDILVKGNKLYSEDTCCFVPPEVNTLVVGLKRNKGSTMLGTSYDAKLNKFRSRITTQGVWQHLGCFDTELEAFYAHKPLKELRVKEVANKWRDQIDIRVYEALMNWNIEITD